MKKKELNIEKLGKVTGGKLFMDECDFFQQAQNKPCIEICENCTHFVEDEKHPGKLGCNRPKKINRI